MIVVPTTVSTWDIIAETDADAFCIDQFMALWGTRAVTSITMHSHKENGTETIVISNQNPFHVMNLLEDSIKKFVQDRDKPDV